MQRPISLLHFARLVLAVPMVQAVLLTAWFAGLLALGQALTGTM